MSIEDNARARGVGAGTRACLGAGLSIFEAGDPGLGACAESRCVNWLKRMVYGYQKKTHQAAPLWWTRSESHWQIVELSEDLTKTVRAKCAPTWHNVKMPRSYIGLRALASAFSRAAFMQPRVAPTYRHSLKNSSTFGTQG